MIFIILNISCFLYAEKKVYEARRINFELLKLDGKLDESTWQDKNWGSDFTQW